VQFTILSHAGLCVEHEGVRIVSDPWLISSCYWRSWWNFPEPPIELVSNLKPDYIYLTHLHWDHFHGISLKQLFDPATPIIVPKIHSTRMLDDLRYLGFETIIEIPHGGSLKLGPDFVLRSFQFNLLSSDSAMLLSGGGTTLLNANDCKHFGWPLHELKSAVPKIDFVLRSHSSATPIPYCIEGYKEMFPETRVQQDYIEEFSRFALHVGARYAIPFASNHCFLHKDTFHFNDTAVSPIDVQAYFQNLAGKNSLQSECVVMAPGSRWDDKTGFDLIPFDYTRRDHHINDMLAKHGKALSAQYAKEEAAVFDSDGFHAYFLDFIGAIPWVVRRILKMRIIFRTNDANSQHDWLLDLTAGKVEKVNDPENDIIFEVPTLVLNDCVHIRMFSAWTPSKRLRVHMQSGDQMRPFVIFLMLLDMYELGLFPLYKNLSWRSLSSRLPRWREIIEMVKMAVRVGILRRPINVADLYHLPSATPARSLAS
jgi:UDP-MurNAc hydroxylase